MIANPGDWVDIKADGTVLVNSKELDEPYVFEKSFLSINISMYWYADTYKLYLQISSIKL